MLFQCDHGSYDFEANLALLKLYQFRPSCSKTDIAVRLLLKSLMQLPATDFVILRCVLPQSLVILSIVFILQLSSLLPWVFGSVLEKYNTLSCRLASHTYKPYYFSYPNFGRYLNNPQSQGRCERAYVSTVCVVLLVIDVFILVFV